MLSDLSGMTDKIRSFGKQKSGPRLYQTKSKETPVSEDEINAILDKISARGYASLTAEERRKLLKAGGK